MFKAFVASFIISKDFSEQNCLETAVSGYFLGLETFYEGRGEVSEALVSSLSNHITKNHHFQSV